MTRSMKLITGIYIVLLLLVAPALQAQSFQISVLINANGDGAGNTLNGAGGITVDESGIVFVAGALSNNAFRITPDGVITEIIDVNGDGTGNLFEGANSAIGVSSTGIVYVGGENSIVFKIVEEIPNLIMKDGFESSP